MKVFEAKNIFPPAFFRLVKHNIEKAKNISQRPKRANGLLFVWGIHFCFRGLSPPHPIPCLATSLPIGRVSAVPGSGILGE